MIVDDRTDEQKQTLDFAVVGEDKFLSGWGYATGGKSLAGWACKADNLPQCEAWVRRRSDMKRVRIVCLNGYRPKAAHTHIYVWQGEK